MASLSCDVSLGALSEDTRYGVLPLSLFIQAKETLKGDCAVLFLHLTLLLKGLEKVCVCVSNERGAGGLGYYSPACACAA